MSADAAVADMSAEIQEHWWIPLVQGIAAIILGILLFTYTGATSAVLAGFVGFYWLISGVVNIVAIFVDSTMWGWRLFIGLLGILAGFIVVTNLFEHPLATTIGLATIFVWVLGIQGLIIGIVEIIQAFQGAGWGRGILGCIHCAHRSLPDLQPVPGFSRAPVRDRRHHGRHGRLRGLHGVQDQERLAPRTRPQG